MAKESEAAVQTVVGRWERKKSTSHDEKTRKR
jgi:hypothetical protein